MYTNQANGKKYIGQTWMLKKRKNSHKRMEGGTSGCRAFYSAIAKYGYDSFKFEVLHSGILLQEELDALEQDEIKKHNSLAPSGYNLKKGGANGSHSEASKKKMSEGVRRAIKEGRLRFDDAWRDKVRTATIAAFMKKNPGYIKKEKVIDHKAIGKANILSMLTSCRKKTANDIKLKKNKIERIKLSACYCEENKTIYDTACKAANILGLEQSCISKILRGDGHSTGGYHFRKLTKQELDTYIKRIA